MHRIDFFKKMEILFRGWTKCFVLALISLGNCSAAYYKLENEQQINFDVPIISEEAFWCARKETCEQIERPVGTSENQPNQPKITFTKMPDPNVVYLTCSQAYLFNEKKEGYYPIRHRNMDFHVVVECKVVDDKVLAIFHHDSESQLTVQGYEDPGSYRKAINYTNKIDHIEMFIDSSATCRQFIRIDCYHMALFAGATQYGFLVDRHNTALDYFGGGPKNGTGCQCGVTNNCANSGRICNCDANDSVWRFDEGYISDTQRLPLTEARFGDTGGGSEIGKYAIGPVQCEEIET